eukprot:8145915-Alexandrium_andersonii.AAC.1
MTPLPSTPSRNAPAPSHLAMVRLCRGGWVGENAGARRQTAHQEGNRPTLRPTSSTVSYTHLRAHETSAHL